MPRLGAPDWAGGNLDALFDILGGLIELAPPFEVLVHNSDGMPPGELAYVRRAEGVFDDARATFGKDVRLRLL